MRKNRFLLRYLQNMRPKKSSENTKRNRQKSVYLYFTYISILSKMGQNWAKIGPRAARSPQSNRPQSAMLGGSYIKEGGAYIKGGTSCIKGQGAYIKTKKLATKIHQLLTTRRSLCSTVQRYKKDIKYTTPSCIKGGPILKTQLQ